MGVGSLNTLNAIALLVANSRVLDHLAHVADLGLYLCYEILRRSTHHFHARTCKLLLHRGSLKYAPDFLIQAVDDGLGRSGRREYA